MAKAPFETSGSSAEPYTCGSAKFLLPVTAAQCLLPETRCEFVKEYWKCRFAFKTLLENNKNTKCLGQARLRARRGPIEKMDFSIQPITCRALLDASRLEEISHDSNRWRVLTRARPPFLASDKCEQIGVHL